MFKKPNEIQQPINYWLTTVPSALYWPLLLRALVSFPFVK